MARPGVLGGVVILAFAAGTVFMMAADADEKQPPAAKPEESQESKKKDLSHFMRLKLEASGKVLEGLAVEDFSLIKEGAQKLNEMSSAEQWRVTNDALYRNFSGDFQRVTKDLIKAANEENLDRAALKWMDATMNCIECHRYARGNFIAGDFPRKDVQP